MSDRVGTREQPSNPEPARLCIEHLCLAIAIVAFTVAVGGLAVEATLQHDLLRGAYSILAALIVCGFVGFIGKTVLRELAALKAGQLEVREALRQRQAAEREVREPVGAGRGHRPRGGDRSEYWGVYSDVMEDLGGIDGPPSET